ncbi:MAG: SDR family oxidoreductase [Bacteroidetes bacterium]|jgi:short-subunit dehydrogenase|nr:SDR family oxidoreductase [Bacteroidota bacterium]MDF1867030.1 SDR family NAD(P)-dependent oxidoreductase [Saprospiraceae bacterium]
MSKLIVTGATKGIGKAVVEAFAAEGFDLALCARTLNDLEAFKAALNSKYPDIQILIKVADMSSKEDVLAFAEFIKSHWNEVDVLINNAGVFFPGEVHKEADGVLETMMETNLYSAYYLTRSILPIMLPQKSGHIFNMCSVASLFAYPNGGAYSITKFALLGFSKVLREELKEKGIRVTSIMPGATWSNSWAGIDLPRERLMEAADIASAILNAWKMSPTAVVEEMIIRPQLGDL